MLATRASRDDGYGRSSRFYEIDTEQGKVKYPSVTTLLSSISKPALIPWAAREERKLVMEAAASLYCDAPGQPKMSKAAFIASLEKRIGTTKAHVRQLEKASDIGSAAHMLIEWNMRKELGQEVGPEPHVTDEAAIAFAGYERWRDEVQLKPELIEQQVWSHTHRYAGTADFIATMLDGTGTGERVRVLGDWKSSKKLYRESHLQVSAYAKALQEMGHANDGLGAVVVRLPKSKADAALPIESVLLSPFDLKKSFMVFLLAAGLWHWQDKDKEEA